MSDTQPDISYFDIGGSTRIAYRLRSGKSPALVFLPGYASDMEGSKAVAIDRIAERRGLAMLRFDYSGTGSSDGRFEDGTLTAWLDQSLAMIEGVTAGPLILIGSSMGGWLALHLALRLGDRVKALVGIAAAPDFTDWGFTSDEKKNLIDHGRAERTDSASSEKLMTTRDFWRSGQELALLGGPIAVECPVRLIHGECDRDVPVAIALTLVERLRSADVQLTIVKGSGHRLSQPREIEIISRTLAALLEPFR